MSAMLLADECGVFGSIAEDQCLVPEQSCLRMSELVAALSVALDITEGQPEGHAARSCLIGMRLADVIGLDAEDRSALFYALLLKDLGCSSNSAKVCWLFGDDDRRVKHDLKTVNWTRLTDRAKFMVQHAAPGGTTLQRLLHAAALAREGNAGARRLIETRCERGAEIARQLQLPEATATAIHSLDELWNGRGHPDGLRGEEIPLLGRICNLAQTVEVFVAAEGRAAAYQMARERRGRWFDPVLVDALKAFEHDESFWADYAASDPWKRLAKWEPDELLLFADADTIDNVAEAFASVVDAKSPWTHKHSVGVADIAVGVAGGLGFSPAMLRDIRRAGLLHDIGKLGVSNLILDKPGKPTDDEFAQIRRHPDFSLRILEQVPTFERLADVAAAHHERLDGRGYHRRLPGAELPVQARILAVSDVYEALTAKRPYRDGFPREKALEIMARDVGTAFCPESFTALKHWLDRTEFTPRVEAQLQAIERLHGSLSGR